MIAEGQVTPEYVGYNSLPWKFTAGTPNIIGSIMAAGAIEFLIESASGISKNISTETISEFFPERKQIEKAMNAVQDYGQGLNACLLEELSHIKGITIYGPKDPLRRTSLVSFNITGKNPLEIADYLNRQSGVSLRYACSPFLRTHTPQQLSDELLSI